MIKVKKILMALIFSPILGASANCSVSMDPIYFGNYNPFSGADVLSSSRIYVMCDSKISYVIRVRTGDSGTPLFRNMTNMIYPEKNTPLKYSLFVDSGRSIIWGDGTGVTQFHQATTSPNVSENVVIYGKIYKSQNVYKGSYRDTIMIDLEY